MFADDREVDLWYGAVDLREIEISCGALVDGDVGTELFCDDVMEERVPGDCDVRDDILVFDKDWVRCCLVFCVLCLDGCDADGEKEGDDA